MPLGAALRYPQGFSRLGSTHRMPKSSLTPHPCNQVAIADPAMSQISVVNRKVLTILLDQNPRSGNGFPDDPTSDDERGGLPLLILGWAGYEL